MVKSKNDYNLKAACVVVAALMVLVATLGSVLLSEPVRAMERNDEPAVVELENYMLPEVNKVFAPETVRFTVEVDGMELELCSVATTVREALTLHKIPIGEDDIMKPGESDIVRDGDVIKVSRIEYREETVDEELDFDTETKGTDDLPAGETEVSVKGEKGLDKVTYKITYADGEEVSREEVKRENVKEPVDEVILKSTRGTIEGREYSKKFTVKAYSYTGGGTTASGKPAAVGRIAVDPSVIPLGTKVYVEGYGFAEAADTGGNIKGNTIDVYFNALSQCTSWGCRYVTIYILR